jgi:Flp pilus assembly protein TadG
MSLRNRGADKEHGQAIAEFAIAAIPMLFLLLGILQFGLIYNAQVGLTNAIRDAARYGSGLSVTDAGLATTAAASTYGRLTGSLADYVSPYGASNLATGTEVCYVQHDDGTGTTGTAQPAWVRVTIAYDHPVIVPLIGAIIAPSGKYRINVTTEIRVDNPDRDPVTVGGPPGVCNP